MVATEPQREIIQWNRRTRTSFINGGAGIGVLVIWVKNDFELQVQKFILNVFW